MENFNIDVLKDKKVLMFDFDGTIYPQDIDFMAFQEMFKEYDIDLTLEQYKQYYLGKDPQIFPQTTKEVFGIDLANTDYLSKYVDTVNKLSKSYKPRYFEYLDELFDKLKDKKFVVVSNGQEDVLWGKLKEWGIDNKFSAVIGCLRNKSKKEIYADTMKYVGYQQVDCALFEDNQRYLDMAKEQGIMTTCIEHKYNRGNICADYIIKVD